MPLSCPPVHCLPDPPTIAWSTTHPLQADINITSLHTDQAAVIQGTAGVRLCGPASRCLPDSSAIAWIATHSLQGTTALRLWPCFTSAQQLSSCPSADLLQLQLELPHIPCKQPVHPLFTYVAMHICASVVPITLLSAKPTSHSLECRTSPTIRNCTESMVCYNAAADCWFSCSLPGPLTIACTTTHLLLQAGMSFAIYASHVTLTRPWLPCLQQSTSTGHSTKHHFKVTDRLMSVAERHQDRKHAVKHTAESRKWAAKPVSLLWPLTLMHSMQWLRLLRSFILVSALCLDSAPFCSVCQASSTPLTCMQ